MPERDGSRKRRGRRSAIEVRELLLAAARELFSKQGYANTSTRDIARLADVSETLLFRHFGTKAALFEKAILEPFNQFITSYVSEWEDVQTEHSAESPSRAYIVGLYTFLGTHRDLVMALLTANAYEVGVAADVTTRESALSAMLDRLTKVVAQEAAHFGYLGIDIPVTIRAAFAMVMGVAVFDDWLFPAGRRRPSEARIINEMVTFFLHGIVHRDGVSDDAADGMAHKRPTSAGRRSRR